MLIRGWGKSKIRRENDSESGEAKNDLKDRDEEMKVDKR